MPSTRLVGGDNPIRVMWQDPNDGRFWAAVLKNWDVEIDQDTYDTPVGEAYGEQHLSISGRIVFSTVLDPEDVPDVGLDQLPDNTPS